MPVSSPSGRSPGPDEAHPARSLSVAVLCTLAAIALALFATAYTPLNTDLGWLLDFGRQAQHLGHLPTTNARSFIEPEHPLVPNEWGSAVLFYWIHAKAGAAGLIALRWLLVAATLCIVAATLRRVVDSALVQLLVLLAVAQSMFPGFLLLRPQLLSFPLLALVIHLSILGEGAGLWLAAAVFAVWANVHAGWMAGIVALAGACGARLVEQRLGWRPTRTPVAVLLLVPLAAVGCLLLNPYGGSLITHSLALLDRSMASAGLLHGTAGAAVGLRQLDPEWMPLWRLGMIPWAPLALSLLLGCFAFTLATLPPRRMVLWTLSGLGVIAALSANRNLRIAPLLMAPALAVGLERLGGLLSADQRKHLERVVLPLAVAIAVMCSLPLALGGASLFRLLDYRAANPGGALWVMARNHLGGRVWSDFNWGGTLLWVLPDSQVGCDGRNLTAYSEPSLVACIRLLEGADPLSELDRIGADMVLIQAKQPKLKLLATRFTPLYCDAEACVLSRLPEQIARIPSLVLPDHAIAASDFFDPPEPGAALADP